MDENATVDDELEGLIAYADGVARDDDVLFDRKSSYINRDVVRAFNAGETLIASSDPDRREVGADIVGMAAEVDHALRDRAIQTLRRTVSNDPAPGPISAAIVKLGLLNDEAARDAILGHARHPDALVRHAVAGSLPAVGLDESALAALRELSRDDDDDVRNWATFGLGTLSDDDDPATRAALLDRLDDPHDETRIEAIVGLARRGDERVRSHLARELADPDADFRLREAAEQMALSDAAKRDVIERLGKTRRIDP